MTFISYAQNFEDVMLWRALKHVNKGFYVDVGANDPSVDSVTRAFYERGWNGINIEPIPSHFTDLQRERPRDINLQCAAGAANGEIEIWECDVRGWATANESVAASHMAGGHEGVNRIVPVLPLSEICARNITGEIHFLKIDVEGFEKQVIEGGNFSCFRPWILVIEATRPNSTEDSYDEWEGMIVSSGYHFAYSDGLNRFYVADEHLELAEALRYPPNVFDDFIRVEQVNLDRRAEQAEAKAQQAEAKAQQAEAKAQQADAKAQQAEAKAQQAEAKTEQAEAKTEQAEAKAQQALTQLGAVYASTSWRIATPLRWTGAWLRKMPGLSKVRTVSRDPTGNAIRFVVARPGLKKIAVRFMRLLPGIESRLRDKRAAQLRADFAALSTAANWSYQAVGHVSRTTSQATDSLAFLNSAARNLSIDEILQNIRAELAEAPQEK